MELMGSGTCQVDFLLLARLGNRFLGLFFILGKKAKRYESTGFCEEDL